MKFALKKAFPVIAILIACTLLGSIDGSSLLARAQDQPLSAKEKLMRLLEQSSSAKQEAAPAKKASAHRCNVAS